MMILRYTLFALAAVLLAFVIRDSYRWFRYKRNLAAYDRPPLNAGTPEFERDSLLVKFAVEKHENEHTRNSWRERRTDDPPENPVDQVEVAEIVYDETGLRMFALVTFSDIIPPLPGEDGPGTSTLTGHALAGIRNSVHSPWELWDIRTISLVGGDSMSTLQPKLRYSYFVRLGQKTIKLGRDWGQTRSSRLVSVGEPGFWESPYWEIGSRYPGLYPFQVEQGIGRRNPLWYPVDPLVKEYPDWIADMYREEK